MTQLFVTLHVLGALVWAGGHLVLALVVLPRALSSRDPAVIQGFEEGYEKLGIPALVVQVFTGFVLANERLPDLGSWFGFGSAVAVHVFLKIALLVVTIALAVHARTRVLPKLDEDRLRVLAWHIVPVTVIAVLMVILGVSIRYV